MGRKCITPLTVSSATVVAVTIADPGAVKSISAIPIVAIAAVQCDISAGTFFATVLNERRVHCLRIQNK